MKRDSSPVLRWGFEYDGDGKTLSIAYSNTGGYTIDMWPDWFEVRCDGCSLEKTDRFEKAVKIAEDDYWEAICEIIH